jgi:hypothetical protein
MVSGIPIAYAHVEDHPYILNTALSAHHACIHTNSTYLNEPDKQCHQLNPATIECASFSPALS